jgi:hypothetical protein
MSFRRPGKAIHTEAQSWQEWRRNHTPMLNAAGLPESVLCDREHWLDFLDHGYLDQHEDPLGFRLRDLTGKQQRVLRELLDADLAPEERVSCLVYRQLEAEIAERDAPPNGGPAKRSDNSGVSEGPPSVS